jgi:ABC-2 type transport system ATP-binding protein
MGGRKMLEIKKLEKRFRRKEVLKSLDLKLEPGIYGLLGENGAGKTTLLRCTAGLYEPTAGEVCWNGENVLKSKEFQSSLGYLPQQFDGLKELKVREFLEYFGDLKNMPDRQLNEQIDKVLSAVHLSEKKEDKVRTLSGGMRRRVGIAQALLNDPKLILFDEPTAGLDPKERLRFQNLIAEYQDSGTTVIISTHIVSDIEALCDHIIVMKSGKVLGVFSPQELAAEAEGKVFLLTESQYGAQKSLCTVVTKTQETEGRIVRVLSKEALDGSPAEPNVEDGYIWITEEK